LNQNPSGAEQNPQNDHQGLSAGHFATRALEKWFDKELESVRTLLPGALSRYYVSQFDLGLEKGCFDSPN
jgi:hypothetical protein